MHRFAIVPILGLAVAGAAAAHAADKPVRPFLSARLTSCTTGPTAPDRTAVFTGSMPAIRGAEQMAMRFDLLERRPGSPFFHRVAVPKLGAWERSHKDPSLPGFIVTKRVEGLAAPGAYRAVVRFRWYDGSGHLLRRARRVTLACRQQDQRADLTIGRVAVVGGPDADHARYVVEVVNLGRGDAAVPFDIGLIVDGAPQPSQTLSTLGGRSRGTVSFVAPRCAAGSPVQVTVDGGRAIDELNEANNTATRPCRPGGAGTAQAPATLSRR